MQYIFWTSVRGGRRNLYRYCAIALVLTICASGAFSSVASAADPTAAAVSIIQIKPSSIDEGSIKLSGKTQNPTPETWANISVGGATSSVSGPSIVRNVSQATLTPFLSDPSRATGAAMIVAPGGGTFMLSMDVQGYQIARWLNELGIAAFVLKYRPVPTPADPEIFRQILEDFYRAPDHKKVSGFFKDMAARAGDEEIVTRQDGIEAVRYARDHASQWKLSPDRIGFIGFAAGAYTATEVALKADAQSKPNLVALIYGAMPDGATVSSQAPAAFIATSSDDPSVPVTQSLKTYSAWQRASVSAELHIFESGGHGFGIDQQGKSSD